MQRQVQPGRFPVSAQSSGQSVSNGQSAATVPCTATRLQRAEPEQQPPIANCVAPKWREAHRRDSLRRLSETPSWLVSMVLHLVALLVLASLVVPYGRETRLDQLLITFGPEQMNDLDRAPVLVEAPQAVEQAMDEPPAEASPEEPIPLTAPSPMPKAQIPSVDLGAISTALRQFLQNKPTKSGHEPTAQMVRIAPVARVESTFGASHETDQIGEADEIVNRFIEYDVGQLTGHEGRNALRDFQRLDAQAIPALVRGLNRSASIRASCPVGVISSKLASLIKDSDDSALIGYAIQNIGKDVPIGEPHQRRILSFAQNLASQLGLRHDHIKQQLAEAGWSVDQDTTASIAAYMSASPDKLGEALDDLDPQRRESATMAILVRAKEFAQQPRNELGLRLASSMRRERDAQRSELLQQTSRRLARRPDWPVSSSDDWHKYWIHEKRVYLMSELSPARLLKHMNQGEPEMRLAAIDSLARSQEQSINDSLRYQLAISILPELESQQGLASHLAERSLLKLSRGEYAGGRSVPRWRKYWNSRYLEKTVLPRSESYLRQAQFLEERGNKTAAAEKYRQLIDTFPETPAAKAARDRLESIIRLNRS